MNKATQRTMFSSATGKWSTPQEFFDKLNWRFGPFSLDPCASETNNKCEKYFTETVSGLGEDWGGHTVFCNPPYDNMKDWAKKCYEEAQKANTTVVLLCPARTDTRYAHDFIFKANEIYFIKGRLKFGDSKNSAPFPSMIAVFHGRGGPQTFGTMNR